MTIGQLKYIILKMESHVHYTKYNASCTPQEKHNKYEKVKTKNHKHWTQL